MKKVKTELERVVNDAHDEMLSIARQRIGQRDAEDAVGEAILDAYEAGEKVDKDGLLQLLYTACERLRGRRRRSREAGFEGLEELCAPAARGGMVEDALAQLAAANLTDLQRQVLQWRLEGHKTGAIAEHLCITPRMVQYHLRACGPKLRRMDVRDLGFASPQAMFDYCSAVVVYRAPATTGSGVAREKQTRLK